MSFSVFPLSSDCFVLLNSTSFSYSITWPSSNVQASRKAFKFLNKNKKMHITQTVYKQAYINIPNSYLTYPLFSFRASR